MTFFPPQKETNCLVNRCEQTLTSLQMVDPGAAVLIGVSGGPDSVALLHALRLLAGRYQLQLGIAHINHGIRGCAADKDAEFVENLAIKLDLPYYIEKIDLAAERRRTGFCLEEAGREARYRFFNTIADRYGYDKIAVGHHREDDAELILMNLIRGSGPTGISGIQPARDRIIRPLIHIGREEILAFLNSRQIQFIQDHTNDETIYRRNHIRHHLIPALKTYNPQVVETLNRLGEVMRSENEWMNSLVEQLMNQAVIHRAEQKIILDGHLLQDFETAPARRIIRRVILELKGNLRRIEFSHIEATLSLLRSGRTSARLDLPDRIRVLLSYGQLILSREKKSLRSAELSGRQNKTRPFEYPITRKEAESVSRWIEPLNAWLVLTCVPRENIDVFPRQNAALMDLDRLDFPITIRNRRYGDRFMPFGMNGTQKIAVFFANNKIPGPDRDRIPLVASGDRVVWVAGYRIDERVKVTDTTKTVLKAELIPATGKYTHTCGGFSS